MSPDTSLVTSLDTSLLIPWLESRLSGFGDFLDIEQCADGQSNPTYRIDTSTGSYIIRAQPSGELLKSAHAVDREYRVMSSLSSTSVPVPSMYILCTDDSDSPLSGRYFYVMEYIEGLTYLDPSLPELDSDARSIIYDSMNRVLSLLHDVDVSSIGLSDYGKSGNYFARQTDRWSKQYRLSATDDLPEMDRLIDWLTEHVPTDDNSVSLVHGDYRLDNIIFDSATHEAIALLDWELSTLGHPLADLSYQCMQLRLPHDSGMRGLGGLDRSSLGIPSEEDYIASYCERRHISSLPDWTFCISFNFFKLASILQGVYRRSLEGNASHPARAREMATAVPLLVAAAIEEIEKS